MTTITERNGVPVDKLRGTIAKLSADPSLAAFEFSAKSTWVEGTATRSTIPTPPRWTFGRSLDGRVAK